MRGPAALGRRLRTLAARGAALARVLPWPSSCLVCQRVGADGVDLCHACRSLLPPLIGPDGTLCRHCGERFPGVSPAARCGACATRRPPFTRLVVPWRYAFPLDRLIPRMKRGGPRALPRALATLLAREALADAIADGAPLPDALVAVPAHRRRRAERRFDHAAELARWAAREAGVPSRPDLAERIVDTGSLAALSRSERALAIRGAFRADPRVAGRRVAIVDDVLTSGATATELARELYDTGAAAVELWVLARTPLSRG